MFVEVNISSHINNLRSLIIQLTEVKAMVEEEDTKAILLTNIPAKCNDVIFIRNQIPCQTLEYMISDLLVEEKRTMVVNLEGDSQIEIALYLR